MTDLCGRTTSKAGTFLLMKLHGTFLDSTSLQKHHLSRAFLSIFPVRTSHNSMGDRSAITP
jgi:hypothetical protein